MSFNICLVKFSIESQSKKVKNIKMFRQSALNIVVWFSLFFVLLLCLDATEKQKRVYFAKKFTGGYFDRVGIARDVNSYIQCASLCLTTRPQCQSFNLKAQNNKTGIYSCEILNEVPKQLDEKEFKAEERSSYFELVYDETIVPTECTVEDTVCKNGANCSYSVVRSCTDQDTNNCNITEQVYCTSKHVTAMTWDDAKETCNSLGGQLAEERNEVQRDALLPILNELNDKDNEEWDITWIGGYGNWTGTGDKNNKTWFWQDGSRWNVPKSHWANFEPNKMQERNCVAKTNLRNLLGQLVTKECNQQAPFICEFYIKNRF